MSRKRSHGLGEVVVAISLATVMVGAHLSEVQRQQQQLGATAELARARAALEAAADRVRAGAVALPPAGERASLAAQGPVALAARRDERPLDPRIARLGLIPVVLEASWRAADGTPARRELTVLTAARGAR